MSPHPAARRKDRESKPIPPAISATPLITTSTAGEGSPGGTIARYGAGFTK